MNIHLTVWQMYAILTTLAFLAGFKSMLTAHYKKKSA